jgi:hypothetical protein
MSGGALERLEELRRQVARELRPPSRARSPKRAAAARQQALFELATGFARILAIVTLPFVLYVRAAVYFYQRQDAGPWTAIAAAGILTTALVAGVVTWASRRVSGRARVGRVARWVAIPLATTWCLYAAFYIARANAKTDAVRSYYAAVHPVLRVALATVILIDADLVITDTRREAADYARMGLPEFKRTLHYEQQDGWVHAIDLRTIGRSAIANRSVQLYFQVMGFRTLRHVGNADHLHVSLPRRG